MLHPHFLATISFLGISERPLNRSGIRRADMETKMDTLPQLLTVQEFRALAKIGHGTFYREVSAGRLRVTKIGRATRIAMADAQAWLENLPTQTGEAIDG